MNKNPVESGVSPRAAALTAGLGLVLMAVIAPVANFAIIGGMIVPGLPSATLANIEAGEGLYRIAILGLLTVVILDVVVAWALYLLFLPVNRGLSLLTAWFRIIYAALFGAAIFNLQNVLQFVGGTEVSAAYDKSILPVMAISSIASFNSGWETALLVFGLHLLLLSFLAFRAGFVPSILGLLLAVAGFGYLIDSIGGIVSSDYSLTLGLYTFVGEVVLLFWLIWKGLRGFRRE